MISKCSIFVSASSSSIFGGSYWSLAESTLSVFGCVCVYVGVVVVVVVVLVVVVLVMVVVVVGFDGGRGGGGEVGVEECFDGLFMGLPLVVGGLPYFRTMKVGTFWSRNEPVLLY